MPLGGTRASPLREAPSKQRSPVRPLDAMRLPGKGSDELDVSGEVELPPHGELAERLKVQVRSLATELLFEKGFAGKYRGAIYSARG